MVGRLSQDLYPKLDRLPPLLFQPLAAPGRDFYLRSLLRTFELASESHGLIDRGFLVDEYEQLLSIQGALEQTDELLNHEPQFGVDEDDPPEIQRRARASSMLRYFERCGWLRTEMQSDQTARILLCDHSFRILDALLQFATTDSAPLQGIICSIHDLLMTAAQGDNPGVRLPEAARQCEFLQNSLRELEHNIGAHMERLIEEPDVPAVLRRLLHQYGSEVIDSGYHKLKTTDHVSRYRPAIYQSLSRIEQILQQGDDSLFAKLNFLTDSFDALDQKLGRIDDRHKLFVDAAVRRVEKLIMGASTVSGFAQTVLNYLVAMAQTGADLEKKPVSLPQSEFQSIFDLFALALVDSNSMAKPRREATTFKPVQTPAKRPSSRAISRARKETEKQLKRAVGKHRIAGLAEVLLSECESVRVSELDIESADQLALLIYMRTYGDGKLGYQVRDVIPRLWVEKREIGFFDFYIERAAEKGANRTVKPHIDDNSSESIV